MSAEAATEWLRRAWAEWAPSVTRGRLDIGRLVIMTRSENTRRTWRLMEQGAEWEREAPGALPAIDYPDRRPRWLHSV